MDDVELIQLMNQAIKDVELAWKYVRDSVVYDVPVVEKRVEKAAKSIRRVINEFN